MRCGCTTHCPSPSRARSFIPGVAAQVCRELQGRPRLRGGRHSLHAGNAGAVGRGRRLRTDELPYTMSPDVAVICLKAMKRRIVYPYHYFGSDPTIFADALTGTGI